MAVGGGSAIDSSKAIREFALKIHNYGQVGLIAVPITSGTGSEVTSFAVVNDTVAKTKYPLVSEGLTADEAILDAELVKSVPPRHYRRYGNGCIYPCAGILCEHSAQ